eukprot:jgi/Galph1/3611/GphlegSOOS_G2262.1
MNGLAFLPLPLLTFHGKKNLRLCKHCRSLFIRKKRYIPSILIIFANRDNLVASEDKVLIVVSKANIPETCNIAARNFRKLAIQLKQRLCYVEREFQKLLKEQPVDPLSSRKQPFFPEGLKLLVISFLITYASVKFVQFIYELLVFMISLVTSIFYAPSLGKKHVKKQTSTNSRNTSNVATVPLHNNFTTWNAKKNAKDEKESVEWLNASLRSCWRLYNRRLQLEAINLLQKGIEEVVKEEKRPFLQTIDVESFELGHRSPLIFGVERLPTRSDAELVYDFDFRYDGDVRLLLVVRIGPFRRFCLHVPVIASGLDIEATFRVHIRLTEEEPFLGDVSLALVTQPKLNVVIKPFKIVDVMELPGLRVFLRRLLTVEIPKRLVLPNRLSILKFLPDKEIAKILRKKLPRKHKHYAGIANIILFGAHNLLGTTTLGLSNPFCRITVADHMVRSKSDKSTSESGRRGDPVWNQHFEMLVRDPENDTVLFEVIDRYGIRYRTIGTCEIAITSLTEGKNTEFWLPLQESVGSEGRLHVSCYYRSFVEDFSDTSESESSMDMENESLDVETDDEEIEAMREETRKQSDMVLVPVEPNIDNEETQKEISSTLKNSPD